MGNERDEWLKDILLGDPKNPNHEPKGERVDGMGRAAALLGKLDAKARNRILGEGRAGVAQELREKMFTFEDLVQIDRPHLPLLLKAVGRKELLLALRKTTPQVKNWIYKSLSARLAKMLQEDLETMQKVPLPLVEQAQQRIAQKALRLEKEGKIAIRGKGEDTV